MKGINKMYFKMNNHDWEIVEESRQVVKEKYEDAMNEKTIEVFPELI